MTVCWANCARVRKRLYAPTRNCASGGANTTRSNQSDGKSPSGGGAKPARRNSSMPQLVKLGGEIGAARELIRTLESRRDLLGRKRAQFELVTPHAGVVFGEELPRMVGRYFQKGAEICRVAATHQLSLRMNVPEREIGDVRVGHPVRLRTRSFPERVFHGSVSKIGGESERDENNQATYRVELTIENADGLLRPGMTAFARIDYDRRMIGSILLHRIKRALRPELWML